MNLTVISSTPQNVALGSGTYVTERSIERGLQARGHTVRILAPRKPPGLLGHTAQRFAFNLGLSPHKVAAADLVLGLDMDGFTLSGHVHPFVCYVLGVLADEAEFERGQTAQLLRLQARAESRSVRNADMVITCSDYSADRIARLYGIGRQAIGVVPPGIDIEGWQREIERAHATRTGRDRPRVLCVARMYPRKNIRSLIGAVRMLVDEVPDLLVRIVGDGPERHELERVTDALCLSETIQFVGQVPQQELATEFASCDVFCLPSLQEGFGIAFLEAMASGKPVVALRTTSTPELVEDGVNGLLAAAHDEADLASKLSLCLADSDMRAAMRQANLEKAAEYDIDASAVRLLDLLDRVI